MKNSRRAIAVLVCLLALLALPAQAAAPEGQTASSGGFGSWILSLWESLWSVVTGNAPAPFLVELGGACIDPDGCLPGSE
jgi:hypothetical protein